jgi:hypothetical protein
MGLLDDAIREHLELKRRHGADPEEVTRQEREALGAPVRGEFAKPDAAGEDASGEPEEDAAPAGDELEDRDEPAAVAAGTSAPGPDPGPEAEAEGEPDPGTEEDPWLVEDLATEEPEPAPAAADPDIVRPDDEEPAQGEDVLEETPEFLQETPEHDRLWFEQKPPRDFDFDK